MSSSKRKCRIMNSSHEKENEMATALPILDIEEPGTDLARKTVFIKLHLGLLGNCRKVSSSQIEVDADILRMQLWCILWSSKETENLLKQASDNTPSQCSMAYRQKPFPMVTISPREREGEGRKRPDG